MKPQFTKEEFRIMCKNVFKIDVSKIDVQNAINYGYIRKSDLEILIEECETNFIKKEDTTDLEDNLYRCIHAMKAELNKRRDI